MRIRQSAFVFCLLLGATILAGCGSSTTSPPNSTSQNIEILYVINGVTVTTYSVDSSSLAATPVEQPVNLTEAQVSLLQFDPSPSDHFLYTVWSDGENLQHLSVFHTDASGVPQVPALQVLNAGSLSQFNMHRSGRFAYMLEVTSSNGLFMADIRLFHVNHHNGTLKEDPTVQGRYGPANYWPAFLYGFSENGRKLYDTSMFNTVSLYRERQIDTSSGVLGDDTKLISVGSGDTVVIGRRIIIDQHVSSNNIQQGYLNILANTPNPDLLIHCTYAMLSFCTTASNVQLDGFGEYLFLTDPTSQAVHVAFINLRDRKIIDTGNSLPMTAQTPGFAFSPDRSIVYAILDSDNSVHFYHFDITSGTLTEGGTPLPIGSASGICPALYRPADFALNTD